MRKPATGRYRQRHDPFGQRLAGGNGHRYPRAHQVGATAGQHMARRDEFVDGIAGQHHAVKRFARLHAFGRVDTADRLNMNLHLGCMGLVELHQIGQ